MKERQLWMTLIGSLSLSSFKLVTVAVRDMGAFAAAFVTFLAAGRSGGSVELSLLRRGFREVVFLEAGRDVGACVLALAFDAARVVRVVVGTLLVVFERVEARAVVVFALLAMWRESSVTVLRMCLLPCWWLYRRGSALPAKVKLN